MPHTVEGAHIADAALADDPVKLRDELGDLLFQVFFLSLLLEEQEGDLDDVTRRAREARTPSPARFRRRRRTHGWPGAERWEEIKTEREGRTGVFHDVPESLPAPLLARKAQSRGVRGLRLVGPRRAA